MLGTAGVTESSMMQYLGVIELRCESRHAGDMRYTRNMCNMRAMRHMQYDVNVQ